MSVLSFLSNNNHSWLNGYDRTEDVYTPDAAYLDKKYWWRLFVYNNWQSNQSGVDELGECHKLAAAVTTGMDFVVIKYNLGKLTHPIALDLEAEKYTFGPHNETFFGPRGQILGQLFYVRPQAIRKLDKLMQNTVVFDRLRIDIDVEYRDKDGSWLSDKQIMRMKAFAYVANSAYWLSEEGHGIPQALFKPVRRCVVVSNIKNSERKSSVRYYYNEKFEIIQS